MDIAQLAGEDYADLPLAGATYRVGELTLKDWAAVQAWIKATVPGPLASLESPDFKRLSAENKRLVLGQVLEQDRTSWPPRIGTNGWMAALDRDGGHAVFLLAILSKHQPSITIEQCRSIAEVVTNEELTLLVVKALGFFGPKSRAPASQATTSPAGARKPTTSGTSHTRSRRRGAGRGSKSSG